MRQRRARVCRHCELREQDSEQRNPGKDRTAEGSHWCPIVVIGTGNVTATVVRRAQRLCPGACDAAPKRNRRGPLPTRVLRLCSSCAARQPGYVFVECECGELQPLDRSEIRKDHVRKVIDG